MDVSEILNTLLDNPKVAAIELHNENTYIQTLQATYDCVMSCELSTIGKLVSVYIGIPKEWELVLLDIYIRDYDSFPFIPHVEANGKLCLFDLEGVLIDTDLCGIINQCIDRAIEILSDGLNGSNSEDFINEFYSYWRNLPDNRIIKCVTPSDSTTQVIKYADRSEKRREKETVKVFKKRVRLSQLFAATDYDSFKIWNVNETQKNGIYFYLQAKSYIYPPDGRSPLALEFINNLLCLISYDDCSRVMRKTSSEKMFIFQILQPNGVDTYFGVLLKNCDCVEREGCFQIIEKDSMELYPLSVRRVDKSYLMGRISDTSLQPTQKCLLIGCGSIGGYLANELTKAGLENITFVDDDKLIAENVYRHFLGVEYVGQYKAGALARYFEKNIPQTKIRAIDDSIQNLYEDGSVDFNDFSLIISATGNHNINRWLNKLFLYNRMNAPVIYVWNEPIDIGCHAAIIQSRREGCYECFFQHNELTGDLYDTTAYCAPGQRITRVFAGCGGSFVPYGSTTSLKSSALCMDLVRKALDGRCKDNILASMKGDGFHFVKQGLQVSDVFVNHGFSRQ